MTEYKTLNFQLSYQSFKIFGIEILSFGFISNITKKIIYKINKTKSNKNK